MELDSLFEEFINTTSKKYTSMEEAAKLDIEMFVKDYPLSSIENLSIDEYLFHKQNDGYQDTFCTRLQNVRNSSMKTCRPAFYGIYYIDGQIKKDRTLKNKGFSSDEEAFCWQRDQIVALLKAGERHDINQIESIEINSLVKCKLLSVYFPNTYLPMNTKDYIETNLNMLGIAYLSSEQSVSKNERLKKWKDSNKYASKMSNSMFMYFCDEYLYNKKYSNNDKKVSSDQTVVDYLIEIGFEKTRTTEYISEFNFNGNYLYIKNINEFNIVVHPRNIKVPDSYKHETCFNTNLTKFPEMKNGGKTPIHFGISVGFKSTEETLDFIDWYKSYVETEQEEIEADCIEQEIEGSSLTGQVKEALVNIRVNQGVFRERLLCRSGKCDMCGIAKQELLVASHIKPWSSSAPDEKLNPNNGLLLCPNHDKLFDQGMITFDDDGNIMISDGLGKNDLCLLNISSDMRIDMNSQMQEFMKWHRNNIFKN